MVNNLKFEEGKSQTPTTVRASCLVELIREDKQKPPTAAHLEEWVFVFQLPLSRKSLGLAWNRAVAERRHRGYCWWLLKQERDLNMDGATA